MLNRCSTLPQTLRLVALQAAFPEVFASLDGNGDAMARATDIFGRYDDPDAKVREVKAFLKSKGVRDLEPVSLFCDHLSKV